LPQLTYNEFLDVLRIEDRYTTPVPQRPALLPSLSFYRRIIGRLMVCGTCAGADKDGLCRRICKSLCPRQEPCDEERIWELSYQILMDCEAVGTKIEIAGLQHVRSLDRAPVVIGNHMSSLEAIAMLSILRPFMKSTYVIKEELSRYPVIKHLTAEMQGITVGRNNPKEDLKKVLTDGAEKLADGRAVIIFPQSTRAVTFAPDQFNTLGLRLARSAKAPVLPIAVKTDFWANGKVVKDFGRIDPTKQIHLEFGEPFETGNTKDDHQRVITFIQDRLATWKGSDEATNRTKQP
jgi:1-acyl-sn-glycerol-3-phosphate acyltransferase